MIGVLDFKYNTKLPKGFKHQRDVINLCFRKMTLVALVLTMSLKDHMEQGSWWGDRSELELRRNGSV